MAVLAQLVEHQIVALGVTGSNPVDRPKNKEIVSFTISFFIFWKLFCLNLRN